MVGLLLSNPDGGGSGKTAFGRDTCDGHVGAGFLCDEGEDREEAEGGGEGRIKRKRRRR